MLFNIKEYILVFTKFSVFFPKIMWVHLERPKYHGSLIYDSALIDFLIFVMLKAKYIYFYGIIIKKL